MGKGLSGELLFCIVSWFIFSSTASLLLGHCLTPFLLDHHCPCAGKCPSWLSQPVYPYHTPAVWAALPCVCDPNEPGALQGQADLWFPLFTHHSVSALLDQQFRWWFPRERVSTFPIRPLFVCMLLGIPFFQPCFLDYEVSFVYSTLDTLLAKLYIFLRVFIELFYDSWSLWVQTDSKTKIDIHLCSMHSLQYWQNTYAYIIRQTI